MPARAATDDGRFTIAICTGRGAEVLDFDANGKPLPAKEQQGKASICAFAVLGAVWIDTDAPALPVSEALYSQISYRIARELFRATPKPGATSARGPPIELI